MLEELISKNAERNFLNVKNKKLRCKKKIALIRKELDFEMLANYYVHAMKTAGYFIKVLVKIKDNFLGSIEFYLSQQKKICSRKLKILPFKAGKNFS